MRRLTLILVIALFISLPVTAQDDPTPTIEPTEADWELVVQPNDVLVVYNTETGLFEAPLLPGTHLIVNPGVIRLIGYSTRPSELTLSGDPIVDYPYSAVRARTLDGQDVQVDITAVFSIDPANVNLFHTRWGDQYIANFVAPTLREVTQSIVAEFNAKICKIIEKNLKQPSEKNCASAWLQKVYCFPIS